MGNNYVGEDKKIRREQPKFIPYPTMFKVESVPRPHVFKVGIVQPLRCVSCGKTLTWRLYRVAPKHFDENCPICHVKAKDFWKGKVHKGINHNGTT